MTVYAQGKPHVLRDLPAPVALRAHSDRLRLRLFMTSLNRSQTGQEARYSYSLEGELHIRP